MVNKQWVSKDAAVILKELGIGAPAETRLVLVDVERDHPLLWSSS